MVDTLYYQEVGNIDKEKLKFAKLVYKRLFLLLIYWNYLFFILLREHYYSFLKNKNKIYGGSN